MSAGRTSRPILGSLLFLVLAPGTVAGLVPFVLSRWRFGPTLPAGRVLGVVLVALVLAAVEPLGFQPRAFAAIPRNLVGAAHAGAKACDWM